MTDLTLGQRPPRLRVFLTPSSPFTANVSAPVTTTFTEIPVLRFENPDGTETSWESVLVDSNTKAIWSISSDQVNAIVMTSRTRKVRLTYGFTTWMTGLFEVDGAW